MSGDLISPGKTILIVRPNGDVEYPSHTSARDVLNTDTEITKDGPTLITLMLLARIEELEARVDLLEG